MHHQSFPCRSVIQNHDKDAIENSDNDYDQSDEETSSAEEIWKCLHCLALRLDKTRSQKIFKAMKAKVYGCLRKTLPLKQTSLSRFFCVE